MRLPSRPNHNTSFSAYPDPIPIQVSWPLAVKTSSNTELRLLLKLTLKPLENSTRHLRITITGRRESYTLMLLPASVYHEVLTYSFVVSINPALSVYVPHFRAGTFVSPTASSVLVFNLYHTPAPAHFSCHASRRLFGSRVLVACSSTFYGRI
jgi:hypothetical protein